MSKKKIILLSLLSIVIASVVGVVLWQKPKVEALAKIYIEALSKDKDIPFVIKVERTNIGFFPPQLEIEYAKINPRGDLAKSLKPLEVQWIAIRPSFLDLLIGKFWISHLIIEGTDIRYHLAKAANAPAKKTGLPNIDLGKLLSRIPVSQIQLKKIKTDINYQDEYYIQNESLYLRAYNKKTSLVAVIKDPEVTLRKHGEKKGLNFLLDSHAMITKKTLTISKVKVVREDAFFLASGNIYFGDNLNSIEEMHLNTRIKVNFDQINDWANRFTHLEDLRGLKGSIKSDINISKQGKSNLEVIDLQTSVTGFVFDKIHLGDVHLKAKIPNRESAEIPRAEVSLAGNNKVLIENAKINWKEGVHFSTGVSIKDAQLNSFLKQSTIADIPVWLKVNGDLSCQGSYTDKLNVECPGAMTVTNVLVQNGERSKKIIAIDQVDGAGDVQITEEFIRYKATAAIGESKGRSDGVISFSKGFTINYETESLDFDAVKEIAELKFAGRAKIKGSTSGDSRSAVFAMDIQAEDFEFEEYYFGKLNSNLSYKSGTLFFKSLDGLIESTRFRGDLNIDLLKERIVGDIQLPFFRMEDVQQAIIKHVDLENRFLGSGSGRIHLDTPFDVDKLAFDLDARLFKGNILGEDYNEASLALEAREGVIKFNKGILQKERSTLEAKGTINTKLNANLHFDIVNGYLQHSTLMKGYDLPVSGTFVATGKITGPLQSPGLKVRAKIEDLTINKNSYGPAIFSYNNLEKKTAIQMNLPEKLDFIVVLPEKGFDSFFVDVNANKFNFAPIIGYAISKEPTQSYQIETSGEMSGHINLKDWWDSEFSSTIKEIVIDYRANKISSTLPFNMELKNKKLYLNELSLVGQKQFLKLLQSESTTHSSKFVLNGRLNISFFKLIAPFIEKIDGFSSLRLELTLLKNDIRLIGSSYTTDAFIKFPGFPHAFENLSADVLFNQNKILINSITGRFAEGKVLGNGDLKYTDAGKYNLTINTNLEDISPNFPEGMKTWGDANMIFSGSGLPFTLKGDYKIKGGLIEKEFGGDSGDDSSNMLTELLKQEQASPISLDLDIDASNYIEVKNSLVEGDVNGKLKVFDTINQPRIRGQIRFKRNARIKFRDTEFQVSDSNFEFNGNHPINPTLFARAQTRVNSYDINLLLQGTAEAPKLNMTSSPPLPEQQIISMLALGQLPTQVNQNLSGQQQSTGPGFQNNSSSGFQIGTSLLSNNPLGRELKNQIGVDIQFSSSFDDESNVAVPKVTISKRLSKKMEASASQKTGAVQQTEGKFTYELNDQISTIFRLRTREKRETETSNTNNNKTDTQLGWDIEYKKEFD
ncbi:MAG: translocation/assembly module TamB domain-containing protein [Bdellovibrionales bacterium]|nr:translocation/assembly module TamB domain-containing protein [Bdellovibrionales bacterium]